MIDQVKERSILLLIQFEVEQFYIQVTEIKSCKLDSEHDSSLRSDFDCELRRIRFKVTTWCSGDDFLLEGLDSHAGEKDGEDGENSEGDEAAGGGFVLGFTAVSDELAVGEEINFSEETGYLFKELLHEI